MSYSKFSKKRVYYPLERGSTMDKNIYAGDKYPIGFVRETKEGWLAVATHGVVGTFRSAEKAEQELKKAVQKAWDEKHGRG